MPSVASHGVNNLPASCTSLLSAWASQGITIPQCLSWTHLTRFVTLAEFFANIWTQLYLSKESTVLVFPLRNAREHTQSIHLYGNTTKWRTWTWTPNSQAHENSAISRCRKHTLTMFPDICLSAYCIKQVQRVTSQASSHTLPHWLGTQE